MASNGSMDPTLDQRSDPLRWTLAWFHVPAGAPQAPTLDFGVFFFFVSFTMEILGCSSSFLSHSGTFLQPGLHLQPHQYVPLSSPSTPPPDYRGSLESESVSGSLGAECGLAEPHSLRSALIFVEHKQQLHQRRAAFLQASAHQKARCPHTHTPDTIACAHSFLRFLPALNPDDVHLSDWLQSWSDCNL